MRRPTAAASWSPCGRATSTSTLVVVVHLAVVPVQLDERPATCPPVADRTAIPKGVAGIYLFSENGKDLYVGRSRKLRGRILGHSKPTSKPNQAHFAVHLAREAYLAEHGVQPRRPFREDASFMRHFAAAKQRIDAMDVRYVLTPKSRMDAFHAVLEIYVALVQRARFNDFATH